MYAIKDTTTNRWVSTLSPFRTITEDQAQDPAKPLVEGTESELQPTVDTLNAPVAGRFIIGHTPRH